MQENDRVLDNSTVEAAVDNLRAMTPVRRSEMVVAQIVPFLGVLLAEILRAINLAQLPAPPEAEVIEDEEYDEHALLQGPSVQLAGRQECAAPMTVDEAADFLAQEDEDVYSLMQEFDASIPFGSKLSQLQAHLNSFDATQCAQVAPHLRIMVQRLRGLAGTTSIQVNDRFLRLGALVATYHTTDVEVPLSVQVWTEGQLRVLVPYLNGGRTPDCLETGLAERGRASTTRSSRAASSNDADIPEYRVKRTVDGEWEPATQQEVAEFRAHDQQVREEARLQEEADRQAFNQHEASLAQQWDDWALSSELGRPQQPPSRKRVRAGNESESLSVQEQNLVSSWGKHALRG